MQPLRAQEAVNSPKKAAEAQRIEKENIRKDTKPDAAQMKDTKADASQIEDTELDTSQMEEIKIYTAEDFLDFASQCYVDSWSLNKYITLQSDISLLGVEFEMIPVLREYLMAATILFLDLTIQATAMLRVCFGILRRKAL